MTTQDEAIIIAHLKQLYAEYLHTKDIDSKARFFSSHCRQICRTTPSFAARERSTIMRYLYETAGKDTKTIQNLMQQPCSSKDGTANLAKDAVEHPSSQKRSYYTIRPLGGREMEFSSDDVVAPAGFSSAAEIRSQAEAENWIGMRVDLWDDEGMNRQGREQGILVKVQYWWRKEGAEWVHILHDIMYIGSRDGTEGSQGEILENDGQRN